MINFGQHLKLVRLKHVGVLSVILAQLKGELDVGHAVVIVSIALTVLQWHCIASLTYVIVIITRLDAQIAEEILLHIVIDGSWHVGRSGAWDDFDASIELLDIDLISLKEHIFKR